MRGHMSSVKGGCKASGSYGSFLSDAEEHPDAVLAVLVVLE
jgi:hypothetical protein